MTKLIATTALALTAIFATVGPAAAADKAHANRATFEPAASADATQETGHRFAINYRGRTNQHRTGTVSEIVAQTGTGEILRADPKIVAQTGTGSI